MMSNPSVTGWRRVVTGYFHAISFFLADCCTIFFALQASLGHNSGPIVAHNSKFRRRGKL